jgi:pSer/pThr/pTyr-binding forkhead associated (FHA) protein
MYKLVISDDEGKSTVVPLVRDEITIGRKEGNTIRLTERNVSRRHARVIKSNGRFVIEDLHSYNGVRVNGQRIGAETALSPGDQVQIGDYQLALQLDSTDTVPEAMSPAVRDADTAMIAAPGPPARLVMITPPAPGAEFPLTGERVRIGRAEDLDIWVNHRSISREHAEVQKEPDGGLRLIDLGSANGVRVNGKDVQNALLAAGDVVELGQVRFRFVAAGEHYAFDADRTVQMDAVTLDRPSGGSRAPIVVAVVIVLLAIVGAAVLALSTGTSDEPTVRQLDGEVANVEPRPAATQDPSPTPAPAPAGYDAALAACRSAVAQGQYATALTSADAALAERPGDADATACRADATDGQTFERAAALLARGENDQAYVAFEQLSANSAFRSRPQFDTAMQRYAATRINQGQSQLSTAPEEALQHAQFVLNMPGITANQRDRATALERAAQSRIAAANGGRRPPRTPRPEGEAGEPSGGGNTGSSQTTATNTTSQNSGSSNASAAQDEGNVEERARQCNMNGDNACVIRLLEGRARTEQTLAMLIEAYRARGQTQRALQHMRTYTTRFQGTPRARQYQQILAAQSGTPN